MSMKRTPSRWMGPFSAFFRHRDNKKRLEEITQLHTKFPLTEEKNHGKIRRLYDGRGYSAIFYR